VKKLAQALGFKEISLSSELVPMIKFVPRASTTVIDAYLAPIIKKYIENFKAGFDDGLKDTELLFMTSDGSLTDTENFRGFNSILSGPAGGVTALRSIYKDRPLIGFDMGGTSTDVSRFAGDLSLSFDSEIEGLLLQSPQLEINTIAAGGGSRLFYENGMFRVGPESAGSHPGPVCYKKDGYLAVTDANLVLGRLDPEKFPKVFGPNADEALDYDASYQAFARLKEENNLSMSVKEIAEGFIRVANETMARPIREVSSAKGYDVKNHDLVCFGGAAAQHAVAIAKLLGIKKVIVHKYSGILSAYGISLAKQSTKLQKAFGKSLSCEKEINQIIEELKAKLPQDNSEFKVILNLRYQDTDTKFLIDYNYEQAFLEKYQREFGFNLDRDIICDDVIVTASLRAQRGNSNDGKEITSILPRNEDWVFGPKLITEDTTTIYLEHGSRIRLDENANYEIEIDTLTKDDQEIINDPINLAIFANRFMSIAEQMGKTLERTSISTNIKERRDFSCAIFNKEGDLIANAPHQPVHLGSMGYAVKKQIEQTKLEDGDAILTNHPVMGGSHLPDLTVITPVFQSSLTGLSRRSFGTPRNDDILFFVANRAHHADIGGITPGSMPSFSKKLSEEGVAVKSFKLVKKAKFQEKKLRELFKESRLLDDNISDLQAQVAANNQGISLIKDLIEEYSQQIVLNFMDFILDNSKKVINSMFKELTETELAAFDFLDDGSKINLKISIDKENGEACFDFSGSSKQKENNLNTPIAVLSSAILYCLRAIVARDIPLNQGFLKPIKIIVPEGSILNPSEDAAVVAGNVQTSQRIVDVIFKAFGVCGASQGCMNNVIFGNDEFGYYETIGGGAGAGAGFNGASGVHTHMTNTRITDPEILESRYPVVLKEFSIRKDSCGKGDFNGGNGLVRIFKFFDNLDLSLLTERRVYLPYGMNGAEDGKAGENWLNGEKLASKASVKVSLGDELKLLTPGGGAFNNKT
jgi:5-oxoprolinase (ATP-hydrolysing)